MQSIAPDTIEIIVTALGVEIGGHKRAEGWHGPVPRHTAKKLVQRGLARPYAPEAAPAKAVEPEAAVVQTPAEPNVEPQVEEAQTKGTTKRIERNGRK